MVALVLPASTLRIGTTATAPEIGKIATPAVTAFASTDCCEVATTPRPWMARAPMASEGWASLGSFAVDRSKAVTSWPAL
ncbi:hypothetical protein D3C87_1860410 [compost metagenome]